MNSVSDYYIRIVNDVNFVIISFELIDFEELTFYY